MYKLKPTNLRTNANEIYFKKNGLNNQTNMLMIEQCFDLSVFIDSMFRFKIKYRLISKK